MIRTSTYLVSGAVVALACAACTSSGDNAGDRATTSRPAPPPPSSSARPTPVTQPKSVPASVPNAAGVIKTKLVSLTFCQATNGGWQATGTASPRSRRTTSYTVTVFFTTSSATVQAFGQTKVTAPKGRTVEWRVTSKFAAAPGTLCVLRGAG